MEVGAEVLQETIRDISIVTNKLLSVIHSREAIKQGGSVQIFKRKLYWAGQ